jgi:exodeoxyribonuclease-3
MRVRFATWNINSVRPRVEQVARYVREQAPDVLCLQEIKCRESEFPGEAFVEMGLPHLAISGQKGWHGVAIASRLPLEPGPVLDVCREGHARAVSAIVAGVEVHNLYIPAGGDVADRALNPKFDHKLVAPREFDVWNHKFMSRVVSHTPVEIEAMGALVAAGGFIDLVREAVPEPQKLFSWWSYRALDFRASNRGLRLDHLWISPALREAAFRLGCAAARVHDDVRAWARPSDHAPVSADLIL